MTKLSPLQRVRSEHGSKAKLAEKVLGFLAVPADEEKEDFEARVKTLSNAKLIRLFDAHQRVEKEFGSRDELINKIVAAKFTGGNEPYKAKISTFTEPRLLDLARQVGL
ncbi:MAG: hypothetical protein VYE40_19540 [Myxococcota bacterium]|jgi:hypothetical protein|nr:hypothetical protein [Myxococcota bacterium]